MGRRANWWLGAVGSMLAACGTDTRYHVEMSVEGKELVRSLTAWLDEDGTRRAVLPDGVEARLEDTYGPALDLRYTGRFRGELPADLGGEGHYLRWTTELGTAHLYVERLLGAPDPWAVIESIEAASDRTTDLWIGWLASEVGDEPWFGDVKTFLDHGLRRDLKNVGLQIRLAYPLEGRPSEGAGLLLSALQHVFERGYVHPQQTTRAYRLCMAGEGSALTELVFDAVPELPNGLRELLCSPDADVSFARWFGATYPDEATDDPPSHPLVPWALAVLPLEFFGVDQRVETELLLDRAPLLSNGTWDEAARRLRWPLEPIDESVLLPSTRYAVWVEPDEAAQRARFGAVLLTETELLDYALWRKALSDEEAAQWGRFLAALSPTADVQAFSFSGPTSAELAERMAWILGLRP